MFDYNSAYKKPDEVSAVEPEAVEEETEDLVEESEPVEEEPIEEEPIEEEPVDLTDSYVLPFVDDEGKLRVRKTPGGEVVAYVSNQVRLKVLKDDDPEWMFVEFKEVNDTVRGYVKKSFVVEE